ncbi:hypothetical protein BFJ69_g12334 [Fusarium oxysporum]|uniref:Uncharacterized protein n=1 Tax=Fusarium oxysporum TaxID=5507 RepID=A0A420MPG8_FUSOX|nr:hypothetical protein BFJ69_g12334 [Fusarium oxysporum]
MAAMTLGDHPYNLSPWRQLVDGYRTQQWKGSWNK